MQQYQPLEPTTYSALGTPAPTFNSGVAPSLITSTTFLYTLFFSAIVVGAFYRYGIAGLEMMRASEEGLRKSKEIMRKTTFGLLGVFSLFLILLTVNKDMLLGDIGLGALALKGGEYGGAGASGVVPRTGSGSGTSRACDSVDSVKAAVASNNICGGASCSLSSSCLTNNPYLSTIKSLAAAAGVDYKLVVVTMCKESGANPGAQNINSSNGSYDCGLMQINQSSKCDASILDPQTNIARGIALMKQKIAATNQSYPGFPNVNGIPVAGVFASYNCCANSTVPNDPSADCTTGNGWSQTIPKWACPINPGSGDFNMCGVKAYACELVACLGSVP